MASKLQGTSILITGATAGIGYLAAEAMARAGATLIIHGRDGAKVERCVRALSSGDRAVRGVVADLASLEQTRQLAEQIAREEPSLDVLINNAGIGIGRPGAGRELSPDGHELRFVVNYLAPFLLTERLLAAGLPRRAVLNVASIGQEALDFDDLTSERDYTGIRAYRRSKLALVMWTFDLAERYPQLAVHSLHPGTLLDTNMVNESGIPSRGPASRGADSIMTVLEHALGGGESGLYFDERTPAHANPQAYDRLARERLHATSIHLVESVPAPV
jgi:NAD(P)-dependent dehydrogenase (short-subunit alcohol dehydrogenase family)